MNFKFSGFILVAILSISCEGKRPIDESSLSGRLQITFDNVIGTQDLELGTTSYTNGLGQSFKVTNFNYYISNIRLKRANGTFYTLPQDSSYFLVRERILSSQTIQINQLPFDEYTGISFLLGVDSLRNTMDISKRTGVLDPATGGEGHYWTWNSGYIFMRFEGTSPESTGSANLIQYHVGGFGGYNNPLDNNIKTISLDFGTQKVAVKTDKIPIVKIKADALKVISGMYEVDFATLPNVMSGAEARKIAENSSKMFEFIEVK